MVQLCYHAVMGYAKMLLNKWPQNLKFFVKTIEITVATIIVVDAAVIVAVVSAVIDVVIVVVLSI